MTSIKKFREVWAELVAKAWLDPDFRELLRASPAEQLAAHGIKLPAGLGCEVVTDSQQIERRGNTLRLPLPVPGDELSEEELVAVAGGGSLTYYTNYFVRQLEVSEDYSMMFMVPGYSHGDLL